MKIAGRIMAAVAAAVLVLGLVACSNSSSVDNKVYIIATDTSFAPFEYADDNGTYVGIDVEILAAIAKDQGFMYQLQPVGFSAALEALQSGQVDGVIAGMSITNERRESFDFSQPYYDSTVCAATTDPSITSLADLEGKTVAVKTGTMSEKWAHNLQNDYGFETVSFDDSIAMYQDVLAGNTSVCFEDTSVMRYAIATGILDLTIFTEVATDSPFATPYGFAVKKGANAELLAAFDAGLANIKANGTYDEIVNKYLQSVE